MDKRRVYVYPRVGLTGLCNMFYPWARAVVWARDNNAHVIAPDWVRFWRVGVWLRWERDKRTYLNQFTNKGYICGVKKFWLLRMLNPLTEEVVRGWGNSPENVIVGFSGREEWGWMELFKKEARFLRSELERITNPRIINSLSYLPKAFIGVHIRKGDFKYGDELQDDAYYLEGIFQARKKVGALPVLVFSDGEDEELQFLNKVSDLYQMPRAPAIHDVLALSRAKAIVGTNHSTFSYWGAFLSCGKPSIFSRTKHKTTLPEDVCPVIYV